MSQTELTAEQRLVLEALVAHRGSQLREVHQALVEDEETRFEHSPDYGDNYYNDEREEVQRRLQELQEKDLAKVDGRGKPWYPTTKGERLAER